MLPTATDLLHDARRKLSLRKKILTPLRCSMDCSTYTHTHTRIHSRYIHNNISINQSPTLLSETNLFLFLT